jgi:hypothetical protein
MIENPYDRVKVVSQRFTPDVRLVTRGKYPLAWNISPAIPNSHTQSTEDKMANGNGKAIVELRINESARLTLLRDKALVGESSYGPYYM